MAAILPGKAVSPAPGKGRAGRQWTTGASSRNSRTDPQDPAPEVTVLPSRTVIDAAHRLTRDIRRSGCSSQLADILSEPDPNGHSVTQCAHSPLNRMCACAADAVLTPDPPPVPQLQVSEY